MGTHEATIAAPISRSPHALDVDRIAAMAGWVLPFFLAIVAIYYGSSDEHPEFEFAFSAMFASIACMVAVAATGYRLISLVTLVMITHIVAYPLAVFSNLLLEYSAVRPDLWSSTDLAMWGCAIGCLAMAAGARFVPSSSARESADTTGQTPTIPSVSVNLCLFAFLVPTLVIRIYVGLYNERFVDDVFTLIEEASHYNNLLSFLHRFSQLGMCLQLFRYMNTGKRKDGWLFIGMCTVGILVFLPTGGRALAFGFVPWFFFFYLSLEKSVIRATRVFLFVLFLFSFVTAVVGVYRHPGQAHRTFFERMNSMVDIATGAELPDDQELSTSRIVAGRLADYVSTGRIIQYTPDLLPFRGSQALEDLWLVFVPKLIFPNRPALGESEVLAIEEYGVHHGSQGGGSSPTMIIGDLYSRWGWGGVVFGMAGLGMILSWISRRFLRAWDIQSICFYVLYVQLASSITFSGLFNTIVTLTRELLISLLISVVIARIIGRYDTFVHSRMPPSRRVLSEMRNELS